MNYFTSHHPNSPDYRPRYEGPIDCPNTLNDWVEAMQRAEKLRATLDRAMREAQQLEAMAKDCGIKCEEDMYTSILCTAADLGLDSLIERIDGECARYEDR